MNPYASCPTLVRHENLQATRGERFRRPVRPTVRAVVSNWARVSVCPGGFSPRTPDAGHLNAGQWDQGNTTQRFSAHVAETVELASREELTA